MTGAPSSLRAVEFTPADQSRFADFDCGAEPWSEYVAHWIRGDEVLRSMERGTRVWLFGTELGELVGFGALGPTSWKWPPPGGPPLPVQIIPALGIDVRFQGKPADPAWRYSVQIMSHLIAEACAHARTSANDQAPGPKPLVLLVHRDNERARRFYEKIGFRLIENVVRRHDHLIMHLSLNDVEIEGE